MVSPAELESWKPATLTEIAESILGHRRVLTALDDDLADGRPPASWTFADADAARAEHGRLTTALATQVSETTGVIDALDAAAAAIATAQASLAGATSTARSYGMTVDPTSGAVRSTRTYEDEDERADARLVQRELATQITSALNDAQAADDALAAALTTASTTDVNTVGTLTEQRRLADFEAKSPAEQVQYLLDHPEAYAFLADHVSPEVKEQVGEQLADDLGKADLRDAHDVRRAAELLGALGGDPTIAGALHQRLGATGLLSVYRDLEAAMLDGDLADDLGVLADQVRSSVQAATQDPGFDGERFGADLVRGATAITPGSGSMGSAVLDHLLREGEFGEGFLRGVAWELDAFERADPARAAAWVMDASANSPLNLVGAGNADGSHNPDPMAAVMGQLGHHPQLGLEFFTDEARAEYYFGERSWRRDEFGGIAEAALAIGTDPENIANNRYGTSMVVSQYFDHLARNPAFDAHSAAAAAEPVASLLKHYMPAVEGAVATPSDLDAPGGVRTIRSGNFLPAMTDYPQLDSKSLNGLLEVALSTEAGMARIAEGVAGYRQAALNGFHDFYPGGGIDQDRTGLQNILDSSMRLDGYMQHAVAEIAIEGAKSADQRVAVFTALVSEATGLVPVPFADELGGKLVDSVWGKVQEVPSDRITEAFGTNEDAMRDKQTGDAQHGRMKAVLSSYLALAEAGLVEVPADMSDFRASDGSLISVADMDPVEIPNYYNDATTAMESLISESDLLTSYLDPFTEWVDE